MIINPRQLSLSPLELKNDVISHEVRGEILYDMQSQLYRV
jgi:hypothetical protein